MTKDALLTVMKAVAEENRFEKPQGDRAASADEDAEREIPATEAQITQAPSTLRAAIPESTAPPSTLRAAIPTPEAVPSQGSSFILPASSLRAAIPSANTLSSNPTNIVLSSRSATATVTVSTTVLVAPTPDPATTIGDENPDEAPSESPVADSESVVLASETTMSPSARAGVGVGITFGVLSIAGMAGLYLWRRHRNQQGHDDKTTSEQCNILGKFFGLKKYKDNKQDPEWSIESAEKVPIVKNMRAQSVSTVSRSDSRSSDTPRPGTGSVGTNTSVVPPRRNVGLSNTALRSHPITPDASAFPIPPSFTVNTKMSENVPKEKEQKSGNWPLPE